MSNKKKERGIILDVIVLLCDGGLDLITYIVEAIL